MGILVQPYRPPKRAPQGRTGRAERARVGAREGQCAAISGGFGSRVVSLGVESFTKAQKAAERFLEMSDRIGPHQSRIITALKCGGELYQERGWWYFSSGDATQFQSRRRCFALYIRGFIMAEQDGDRTRYSLTEKGKRA